MPPKLKFGEGERILCYHGPLIYEAKCMKGQMKDKVTRYLIHYNGWNKNWDEWVPENRVLKFNEANLQKQRELREQNSKSKKSRKRTDKQGGDSEKPFKRESVVDAPGPARKKRSRIANPIESDENYISRVDVKITIPDDLKQWLIDDWDLVTRQKQLVPIPRKKNIKEILDEYIKSRTSNPDGRFKPGVVQEVADGIQEYFNVMLGTHLLYKFERTQYGDVLAEHTNLPMSHLYGAEHLLRLFVKLGNALSFSNLDEKSVQFVVTHIQDFLDYLSKNADSLFTTDYETATPEYHRRAAT
ncbi:mortality factor 4-like protein 1 [Stylophora pistillata]|uniref:Mortality factor 4-like protein 1 n=1 Tax=Stylophora pistillata TaxID=50429 RepID=A0A2B4RSU5_STYPI|nr:mortality factor 4-like protein 1 [Stylophora pistillata]PFX21504.1 Mortality factor 4-like protein 1 [Stylophora pistillata]